VPILRPETILFPSDLFEGINAVPCERRWSAVYTKPRQEKALARQLLGFQIPFYLPLIKKTVVAGGRKRMSHVPLFSGYIFLFNTETERVRSLTTNRILRILAVDDQTRLLGDLRQLRQLIAADAPLTVESRLVAGDRVRVRSGPFAGIEGTVMTRRGMARLLVAIDFLQKGASVEIEDFLLEPLT
jgi:transcription antitermination factor NusG